MDLSRRSLLLGLGAGAFLRSLAVAAVSRHVVATTRAGRVRGVVEHGVNVFRGVPYGSARRFLPPRAPAAWQGRRDALAFGPASPQHGSDERAGEDCLVLNAWTPALRDGAKRPVLVYIHGGEFSSGSSSPAILDGARLCRRGDVVVVTLNHRLNAFGHLYLARLRGDAYASSGNVGLLDLVLALAWVRDHAAELGGDAGNVTVFGQSGGGAKIATLMAMPAANGLFHRTMTMSGQQVTASGPRGATLRAEALMHALGIDDAAKLDDVPVADIVAATQAPDATIVGRPLYFGPVLDHDALPRHPFYPDAPAQSAAIPMLIGNTRDETRAWLRDEPGIESLGWDELPARLLPQLHVDIGPEHVVAEYRRMYPRYTPTEVFFAATTAGRSWRGALIEAELRAAQGAPTWCYQLDFRSTLEGGKYGAMHTMDIPLVFDNVEQPGSLTGATREAQATADAMSSALIAFARTGRCDWPRYELARRATMVFDARPRVVDDPRSGERELFASVPYIQRGTY